MPRRTSRGELERQLADYKKIAPLAQEIGAAAARLAAEDTADLDTLRESLGGVITKLTGQERQKLIIEAFKSLPAVERAQTLLGIFDENTLRVALEAERAKASRSAINGLAEIAQETDGLDLTLLPFRANIEVTLCNYSAIDTFSTDKLFDYAREARWLKFAHMGQGRYHLLEQEMRSADDATFYPDIEDQQVLEMGCLLNAGLPDEQLEHVLYFGATLGSTLEAGRKFSVMYADSEEELLVIGHVNVNGTHILGYAHSN